MELDPLTGSGIQAFGLPGLVDPKGMAYKDNKFYIFDESPYSIKEYDSNFNYLGTINTDFTAGVTLKGFTTLGSDFLIGVSSTDNYQKLFRLDSTGNVINDNYRIPFQMWGGLTSYGNDIYAIGGNGISKLSGFAVVPEPISSILFLTGGGVLAGRRIFRKYKC